MRRPPRRHRGFSLVELLVGATVSSLILVAVASSVVALNNVYQRNTLARQVSEHSRLATSYLERSLRLAGYGLPPERAFGFDTTGLPGGTKDNHSETTAWGTFITDDLAFRFRDPTYMRRGTLDLTSAPYVLALEGGSTFGRSLPANHVLMLACVGGQQFFVGRVEADTGPTATSLRLLSYGSPDFSATPPSCTSDTGASAPYVLLVYEKRLRVLNLDGRPFLVVLHGWSSLDDYDPIAANVEAFQVSYVMNRPSPSGPAASAPPPDFSSSRPNWVLGDEPGVDLVPNPTASMPTYDMAYQDPARFSAHPSNIRAVRVGLTVRAPRRLGSTATSRPLPLANYAPTAVIDGYLRSTVESTVRVPNMLSRTFFTPALRDATNSLDRNNVWGG